MKKNTNNQKQTYQSPLIEVYIFKVETGYAASGGSPIQNFGKGGF